MGLEAQNNHPFVLITFKSGTQIRLLPYSEATASNILENLKLALQKAIDAQNKVSFSLWANLIIDVMQIDAVQIIP